VTNSLNEYTLRVIQATLLLRVTSLNAGQFQNPFTDRFSIKFAIRLLLNIVPLAKIAIFENRVNRTAMQNSTTQNSCSKIVVY